MDQQTLTDLVPLTVAAVAVTAAVAGRLALEGLYLAGRLATPVASDPDEDEEDDDDLDEVWKEWEEVGWEAWTRC